LRATGLYSPMTPPNCQATKGHTWWTWSSDCEGPLPCGHTAFSWGSQGKFTDGGQQSRTSRLVEDLVRVLGDSPGDWKTSALCLGESHVGLPASVFVDGARQDVREPMAFFFYVLQHATNGKVILVDCGFTSEVSAKAFGIEEPVHPVHLLQECGLQPSQVTDVIVTHGHWDHLNGIHLFPQATVWISHKEFKWLDTLRPNTHTARRWMLSMGLGNVGNEIGPGGVTQRDRTEGRLRLLDFTHEQPWAQIAEGVLVIDAHGAHTSGSTFVACSSGGLDDILVLASDCVMSFDNLAASGQATGCCQVLSKSATIVKFARALASKGGRLVPGHDRQVLRCFEQVAPHVFDLDKPLPRLATVVQVLE